MPSRISPVLLALSVACLVVTIVLRPIWYDEILGHWTSTLPWPSGAREATRAGVDLQPPGWYLLVRAGEALTGSLRGPRLFGLVGVVGAAFLVGRLAHERYGRDLGHLAAAALLVTGARAYAAEGRPYGLLLGCSALAFFAWCRIAHGSRRAVWIPVLGVSLFAAAQLHYFAVLLWFPLAIGELARARARGRLDWVVAAVGVLALLPMLAFVPDARQAGEHMRIGPFSAPSLSGLEIQYRSLLAVLLGVLVAPVLLLACRDGVSRTWQAARVFLREPSQAATAAFLLLPAVAMLLAIAGGSGLSHQRYALAFTLGASLAAAGLLHALGMSEAGRRRAAACLAFTALVLSVRDARRAWRDGRQDEWVPLVEASTELVRVFPSGLEGLEYWQASDEVTRSRILLAADPQRAVADGWKATVDVNLSGARGLFPFPVADWNELRELEQFVLLQPERSRSWLMNALLCEGAQLEPIAAAKGWEAWIVRPLRRDADPVGGVRRPARSDSESRGIGELHDMHVVPGRDGG